MTTYNTFMYRLDFFGNGISFVGKLGMICKGIRLEPKASSPPRLALVIMCYLSPLF